MIDVTLFGPTVVTDGGTRVTAAALGGTKVRQLLEMLAWDVGSPLSKDLIADRLWDGRPPASHIATVESHVCVLRRRLGLGTGRRGPIATTSHGYVLDPDLVRVDAAEARRLLQSPGADASEALDLMSGELLADEPYAAWAIDAREAFAQVVTDRCTAAARRANRSRRFELAVRLALQATRSSCFCEAAVRELMRGLAGSGSRVQALTTYETLRRGMAEELGLAPEAETQSLHRSILHGSAIGDRHGEAGEISALLLLLRSALEADSSTVIDRPAVNELGRLLLARAV